MKFLNLMKIKLLLLSSLMLLFGCSKWDEAVMPYHNLEYIGDRLFPVSENDADFTFRAWVSYSTSIDRVFTVSHNKELGYQGQFLEIAYTRVNKKNHERNKFREKDIVPNSGFEKFIQKIDSLNLTSLSSQKDFPHAFDVPAALIVIEIKSHNKFNHFRFSFDVDDKKTTDPRYDAVKSLIADEFNFQFYFPDGRQPNFR